MRIGRRFAQFDYALFLIVAVLASLGILAVYSATLSSDGGGLMGNQLFRAALGVLLCLAVTLIDYHRLLNRAFLLYFLSLVVLVGVLLFGTEINGNKSWIVLGGLTFQPSELTKVVLILLLARLLSDFDGAYLTRRRLMTVVAFSAVPIFLVVLQHDLGTAVMFVPIVAGVVLVAGIRAKAVLIVLLVVMAAAPVTWFGLKDYHRQRVLVTLDPDLDPQGVGYQTRQARIAIGSGGLWGRGVGQGLQSQLGFVPESHTDFIFALMAEETGFMGASGVLLLYLLLLARLITVGRQALDRAGMLIVAGIVALIFSHVAINVGMALGIVPPIGIPLPFLSYGGSSIVSTFAAVGLALNVSMRRFLYT
jgi:rod shape determining protein RodA